MWRRLVIPVLILALIITGYIAYQQKQINADVVSKAEAQYQKNFHELVWNVDNINAQLAQALVTSTPEQIMNNLTNLGRECFGAQTNLASLPLVMIELTKTQRLLDDIADYSYYLLKENNLKQKELSAQEWEMIQDLYDRSRLVCDELSLMRTAILNQNISLVEMEDRALAKGMVPWEHLIIDGFTNLENKVLDLPEIQFDEGIHKLEREARPIAGSEVTIEEALMIAREFFNNLGWSQVRVELDFIAQGQIPTFGFQVFNGGSKTPTYLEISRKGGQIVQIYATRKVKVANLEIGDAEIRATQFLAYFNFPPLELVDVDLGLMTAIFTFVPVQENVLLYSDMLKVSVALDNGKILGFDQTSYLSYHFPRIIETPALMVEEITQRINPNFKIFQTRLALIPDDFKQGEHLAYEIRGQINHEKFILFVNAQTGEDMRMIRLTKPRVYEGLVR